MIQWVKALHVISIIAWMAALLYLPRLMVYHADSAAGSEQSETFRVMERRLLKAIAGPAMLSAWIFGLWLVWLTQAWSAGWFWAKLLCVVALSVFHGLLARWVKAFGAGQNRHSSRFFRIVNELPTALMIAIIILVIVQPF